MLNDITIGQFFPGKSVIHKMDARMKIILTVLYITALFLIDSLWGYLIAGLILGFVIAVSRIKFKLIYKSVKPLIFIVLFTGILNILYTPGNPLFQVWIIKVTDEGLITAAKMIIRILFLVVGTSMLTYTTSPTVLTDALERLLNPLKKIKIPVHEIAMMMTIALRFIPTLIEETEKIMNAQKARGADFESGSLMKRAGALVPILVPMFISAFRRADELAVAMECRCYNGGEGRTRMKQMKFAARDYLSLMVVLMMIGGIITLNILL